MFPEAPWRVTLPHFREGQRREFVQEEDRASRPLGRSFWGSMSYRTATAPYGDVRTF